MKNEDSTPKAETRVTFTKAWEVAKSDTLGLVLHPITRCTDGQFRKYGIAFQMNRYSAEELLGQIRNLLATLGAETVIAPRMKVIGDADLGQVHLEVQTPSGQVQTLRLTPDAAETIARNLMTAASHCQGTNRRKAP